MKNLKTSDNVVSLFKDFHFSYQHKSTNGVIEEYERSSSIDYIPFNSIYSDLKKINMDYDNLHRSILYLTQGIFIVED